MKKYYLFIPILLLAHSLSAQSTISLKISYASPNSSATLNYQPTRDTKLTLEASLIKHPIFQPDIYVGISRKILENFGTNYPYGAGLNIQLIPLIIENPIRFNVYCRGEIGGGWFRLPRLNINRNSWEYGLGAGASLNLNKRFGLFTECTYGQFYYKDKTNLKFGLQLSF